MTVAILLIACLAMLAIALEEVIHLNKAKSTLFLGCLSWLILYIGAGDHVAAVQHALNENLLEIATLWLFLMATMTFDSMDALNAAMGSDEGKAAGANVMGFAGKIITMTTAEVCQVPAVV